MTWKVVNAIYCKGKYSKFPFVYAAQNDFTSGIWPSFFLYFLLSLLWILDWSPEVLFHWTLDSLTLLEFWLTHWLKYQPSVHATNLPSPSEILLILMLEKHYSTPARTQGRPFTFWTPIFNRCVLVSIRNSISSP